MILDVIEVWDAAGRKVEPTPSDSFLSTSRIERVEPLRESLVEWDEAGEPRPIRTESAMRPRIEPRGAGGPSG